MRQEVKGCVKYHKYKGELDRQMETRSLEDATGTFHLRQVQKERELKLLLEGIDGVSVQENSACGHHEAIQSNGVISCHTMIPPIHIFE